MLFFHLITFVIGILGVYGIAVDPHSAKEAREHNGSLTNAERLARGLGPAMPNSLERLIPSRSQGETVKSPIQRAVCPSSRPVTFPPHPVLNNETVLLSQSPGPTPDLTLPFPVRIFDRSSNKIVVNEQGWIDFDWYASLGVNEPIPSDDLPLYSVVPYWDRQFHPLVHAHCATFPTDSYIDFTLYYNTQTPGWWYVYYDRVVGNRRGNPATIGVQGLGTYENPIPDQWTQYSYNRQGAVFDGLRLAFDTSCPGRYYVG
ncbi:hypothetical protein I302_103703 [Kwoniella bestiolae CBS 10118]|uniref:Neprosin domain-containing protein n=1 Tax=Kwoniella bestiolae CBS 10118 TaxID=1296100 RepID=A0AAJ8K6G0_9TREE